MCSNRLQDQRTQTYSSGYQEGAVPMSFLRCVFHSETANIILAKEMTVELSGGLGNVMFQLAAAYAMSRRYDKDVAVTPHPLLKVFEQHPAEDTAPKSLVAQEEAFRFSWSQWDDVAGISDVLLRGYFQSSQYWEKATTKHLLAFREEH